MVLELFSPGDAFDVGPLGSRLQSEMSCAVFKGLDVEAIRLVLPANSALPPHHVAGEMTIQCIEGALEICIAGVTRPLNARQLLFVERETDYALRAVEDSSALVTVVLRPWRLSGKPHPVG
jgi:quercetin dioxygenase-like cupin family protein